MSLAACAALEVFCVAAEVPMFTLVVLGEGAVPICVRVVVILDYDASGRVGGIELVGDEKPCQQR